MAGKRSRQDLLDFLDYLAAKGLMAKATAASRKAAVGKVLGVLPEEEAQDVTKLDLDDVMSRFQYLEGKGYTPSSLSSYLSRVKSAVDDFEGYLENPLGFKPRVQAREKRKPERKKEGASSTRTEQEPNVERQVAKAPLASSILPIPIRADVTVFIQGLPYDLTEAEAAKIANVVRAMAVPSE